MTSTSQRPNSRDGTLSALDVLIQVLTLAKDTCGVPPAQIVLGSALALLTMIRVRFPPPRDDDLLTPSDLGFHDKQTRLPRTRDILRGCMSGPGPGTEWEANERTERVRAGGHQETDYVSCTSISCTE